MNRDTTQGAPGATLRIGVLGAAGQLGRSLVRAIADSHDLELAFAATREDVDLSQPGALGEWLSGLEEGAVDLVINAAAFTRVDDCERMSALAYQVNALAPAELAAYTAARGLRLIHVSTDYVFRGDAERPYTETDETEPMSVYGASKRAGEVAVLGTDPRALVVRSSWIFGPGTNFVGSILEQARRRRCGEISGPLRVVDDQRGSPTSALDLAEALLTLGRLDDSAAPTGLLHLCNEGETSWYGFACQILEQAGCGEVEVEPVDSGAFEAVASRPAYSVLDCGRADSLGLSMRPWPKALAGYLSGPDRPDHAIFQPVREVQG